MAIVSCTLGCSVGAGNQVSCGVTDVYVNQEIRITFTEPILLSSVNNNTFQVVDVDTGKTPPGSFSPDKHNNRVLVYRPQLTFDSSGNPIFGLTENATYTFKIPGQALDALGPYILNTAGAPNQNRLLCTLVASRGVFDANPGPPTVVVTVDVVSTWDANGDPDDILLDQDAQGATDVWRDSDIKMVFDDIMNPGTLVNPVTGVSTTVTVKIDPDADTSDDTDQLELAGSFSIAIDQDALVTTVIFTPEGGLPSAGWDRLLDIPEIKRKVVCNLPTLIKDLGGNSLTNSGDWVFTPEHIKFDPVDLGEDFETTAKEDESRTGAIWGETGILDNDANGDTPSDIIGGGSGQLGDLMIPAGPPYWTLNTDTEDFFQFDGNKAIFDAAQIIDPNGVGLSGHTVTGGIFEFSTVRVEAGGRLTLTGSNPGRLFARGEVIIQGVVDVAGASSPEHDSADDLGGISGDPGPAGGVGGAGGMRPDGEVFINLDGQNGVDNPFNPQLPPEPDLYGLPGGGIPFPDSLAPTDFVAMGMGGVAWPYDVGLNLYFPTSSLDHEGMQFERQMQCTNRAPGGAGGGGGYSLDGLPGIALPKGQHGDDQLDMPPDSDGGNSGDLNVEMSLNPLLGWLRGGSGGGGGGGHLQETAVNGIFLQDCGTAPPGDEPLRITDYYSHSGAAGGSAGGGFQTQAGRRILLNGVVDCSGGDGGNDDPALDSFTAPGGGGSGGAILFQSQLIQVQPIPGRFDIAGGSGGIGVNLSTGGLGSPGLLRLETFLPLPDFGSEANKISPSAAVLAANWPDWHGVGFPATPSDIFSTSQWDPQPTGPSALSGAQSCWIQPSGNFFQLDFVEDGAVLGWDMSVLIDGFGVQSWRGDNDIYGVSLETQFGTDLGVAPLVVRFQGARVLGTLENPCNVQLFGLDSPVYQGSLTGWVKNPWELNDYFPGDDSLRANMVRFVVIWDASQVGFDMIQGIEDLVVTTQPD